MAAGVVLRHIDEAGFCAACDAIDEGRDDTQFPRWVPGTSFRYVVLFPDASKLTAADVEAFNNGFRHQALLDVSRPEVYEEPRVVFKPTDDPHALDYNEPPAWAYLRWCGPHTELTLAKLIAAVPIRYDKIVRWDLMRDPNPRKRFRGEKTTAPEIKLAFEWPKVARVLTFLRIDVKKYAVALTAAAVKLLSPDPVGDGEPSPDTSAADPGPTEELSCPIPTFTAPSSSGPTPRPESTSAAG